MVAVQLKVPNWLDKVCAWPVTVYRRLKYGYSFRRIYLDEGLWTIVDSQDYYRFGCFKWYLTAKDGKFYAVRNLTVDNTKTKMISMHREIINAPKGLLVDHKNTDSLDNRRENLRLATRSQNMQNMKKKNKDKATSRFIGIWFDKSAGNWPSKITVNGKKIHLGRFHNEIDAARAYDRAAIKYRGEFARLNFPEKDALPKSR
jgi:hypothetical protein